MLEEYNETFTYQLKLVGEKGELASNGQLKSFLCLVEDYKSINSYLVNFCSLRFNLN